MRYYKLFYDDSNENDVVCTSSELLSLNQYDLIKGVRNEKWNESFSFHFDSKKNNKLTDFLGNDLDWLVVSEKLRNIILLFDSVDAQFFPVDVVDFPRKRKVCANYYVVNVLNVIDCLDLNNSDYSSFTVEGEEVYSIRKYALKQNKLTENHLFKIKGSEFSLFVSEKFKNELTKNNISGISFLEVKVV